jgi:hypothetical protein
MSETDTSPMSVNLQRSGSYIVNITVTDDDVQAEFYVKIKPRRKNVGWKKGPLKHHLYPLEDLQEQALEKIVAFCKKTAASKGKG